MNATSKMSPDAKNLLFLKCRLGLLESGFYSKKHTYYQRKEIKFLLRLIAGRLIAGTEWRPTDPAALSSGSVERYKDDDGWKDGREPDEDGR